MNVINIIIDNIQWIFSGIGVVLLVGIISYVKIIVENKKLRTAKNKEKLNSCVELKTLDECEDIKETIKNAKHELFISAINMYSLSGFEELLKRRNDINIRLLILDLDNDKLLNFYADMRARPVKGSIDIDTLINHFTDYEHIKLKKVDFLTPELFVARDLSKESGYIKVGYRLRGKSKYDSPHIELIPSNGDWYRKYHEQIEHFWKEGEFCTPKDN